MMHLKQLSLCMNNPLHRNLYIHINELNYVAMFITLYYIVCYVILFVPPSITFLAKTLKLSHVQWTIIGQVQYSFLTNTKDKDTYRSKLISLFEVVCFLHIIITHQVGGHVCQSVPHLI